MSNRRVASGSDFETFGQLLKYCRRRAQLTQSELAIACGYSAPHISHLESNQRLPDEATIQALFVPALGLRDEPELGQRLLDLAKGAHTAHGIIAEPHTARVLLSSNMPYWSNSFIGRTDELLKLAELLDGPGNNLLTLVGTGGIGKTRLALQAASLRNTRYTHGIHFVPLVTVAATYMLPLAIASALSIVLYSHQDTAVQLCEYLSDKQMLLILDDFEHILDGTELLARILASAPAVQIMVTSRERLRLSSERVFIVGGIRYPESLMVADPLEYDAIRLFEQEAKRINPDFKLTERDIPAVIEIARFVEGMPLGLLLAAGWVETLSMNEIAQEVQNNPEFLETHVRDVPERQRSIGAAFQHSWQLLSEAEKGVYARLSVFAGDFAREAAQAVAGATLHDLTALLGKSLLRRDPDSGRYEIHQLLRQYGRKQLQMRSDVEATHHAYLNYYAQLLARFESDLKGPQQIEVLNNLDAEFDNIRNAWSLALSAGALQVIEKMIECLYWYLFIRSRLQDLRHLIEDALARVRDLNHGVPDGIWARLKARTSMAESAHEFDQALAVALENEEVREAGLCLLRQSEVANDFEKNPLAAIQYGTKALQAFENLHDAFYAGEACSYLSLAHMNAGQLQQCIDVARQGMEYKKRIHDPHGIAQATLILALPDFLVGEFEQAESAFRQAYDLQYELGQWAFALYDITLLGYIKFFHGDFEGLRALAEEARQLALQMDRYAGSAANIIASLVALVDQDYATCRQLITEAPPINPVFDLGSKWISALVAWVLGDFADLHNRAESILAFAIEAPFTTITATSLLVGLLILVADGRFDQAAVLFARASTLPATGSGLLERLPLTIKVRASLEARLGPTAFAAAWESGKAESVESLIQALRTSLA